MERMGLSRKIERHLKVPADVADRLVAAGYRVPKKIRGATKKKLREDAGLSQSEVDGVKARWK